MEGIWKKDYKKKELRTQLSSRYRYGKRNTARKGRYAILV